MVSETVDALRIIKALDSRCADLTAERDRLRAALEKLNASLLQVDNGHCAICRIGYRSCDTRGRVLVNCSNDECLSYVVAAALASPPEPPKET